MLNPRRFIALTLVLALIITASIVGVRFTGSVDAEATDYEELKIFTEVLNVVKRHYVEDVESKDLIYNALKGMLRALDPHSDFLTPESYKEMKVDTRGEFGGIGIQITIRDGLLTIIAPIEDTPGWRIGLESGDFIVEIDGTPTKDLSLMEAVNLMRGRKGTNVTLTIMREGFKEPKKYTIERDIIKIKSVASKMISNSIGYVKLKAFQEHSSEDMGVALKGLLNEGATSIILDLRNNPGGLLSSSIEIASMFLDRNTLVVYTKDRAGEREEYRSTGNAVSTSMPMVVLVNQGSASASEIVAGALKDWSRAVVLGTTTFGKGSVQSIIPLSDGSGVRITTSKYYTPKGTSIQNTGIQPDIEVKLAKAGHVMIRESDLKGRLDNEQTNDDDEKESPVIEEDAAPPVDEEEGDKEKVPHTLKDEDDVQLQRAVDLLKTWVIFKELPKKE